MGRTSSAVEELFRRGGAELSVLVEGGESLLLQRGEFVLSLVKHVCSPLAAVVATVGDMQWPVGKDSLVFKSNENHYFFSLPAALTFALAFSSPHTVQLQQLDSLLRQYSTVMPLHAGTAEMADAASAFWTRFARNAEEGNSMLNEMRDAAVPCTDLESMSPRLAQKLQQARRMSAVEKLFARSVERGAIDSSTHVTMAEGDASGGGQPDAKLSVASVDAVAKVMEAVEMAGKTLRESAQTASTDWIQRRYGKEEAKRAAEGLDAVGSLITSAWTLNKMGLRMLFRAIASIQSRSNTNSSDGQSSLSTDVSDGLRSTGPSSSSGSLSSISSRLPSILPYIAADNTTPSQVEVSISRIAPADSASASRNTTANAPQGAIQPLPLPPRFYGSPFPPPRMISAVSRASATAPPAGTAPPIFGNIDRTQVQQQARSAAQTNMADPPSSLGFQAAPATSSPHSHRLEKPK